MPSGTTILPHDGSRNWLSSLTIPYHHGLTLIVRQLRERGLEIAHHQTLALHRRRRQAILIARVEPIEIHKPFPDMPDMPWMDDLPPMRDMPTILGPPLRQGGDMGDFFGAFKRDVGPDKIIITEDWTAK